MAQGLFTCLMRRVENLNVCRGVAQVKNGCLTSGKAHMPSLLLDRPYLSSVVDYRHSALAERGKSVQDIGTGVVSFHN